MSNAEGITIENPTIGIEQFLQIYLVMYADDTVLFAESKSKIQDLLNCYINYCELWKLSINPDKTKIVIFGKNYNKPNIKIRENSLEIVTNFIYLGITFSKNGRFLNCLKNNIEKARLAFFSLMNRCKDRHIPIDCKLELFEKCIEPILLYGCEIWGVEDSTLLEKFRLKCYKIIMKAKTSTPGYMLYGELGLLPLSYHIQKRMITYWGKIIQSPTSTISHQLYSIMRYESETNGVTYKWPDCISKILNNSGFGNIWRSQTPLSKLDIKNIHQRLKDITLQQTIEKCSGSNKGKHYIELKNPGTKKNTYLY